MLLVSLLNIVECLFAVYDFFTLDLIFCIRVVYIEFDVLNHDSYILKIFGVIFYLWWIFL